MHGERTLYSSRWVSVGLADVSLPDGSRFEHHVVRSPDAAVAVVVVDGGAGSERLLMLHRHRFITDRWGWELPAGRVDPGEDVLAAAAREVLEETGWTVSGLRHLIEGDVAPGLSDLHHHVLSARATARAGAPEHAFESSSIEWVPVPRAFELLRSGGIPDGYTQYALLAWRELGQP